MRYVTCEMYVFEDGDIIVECEMLDDTCFDHTVQMAVVETCDSEIYDYTYVGRIVETLANHVDYNNGVRI